MGVVMQCPSGNRFILRNSINHYMDTYRIIKDIKDEIKRDCLDEISPQIAQMHETYVNSNASLQARIEGKLNVLEAKIWSRWHLAAIYFAFLILLIVSRL